MRHNSGKLVPVAGLLMLALAACSTEPAPARTADVVPAAARQPIGLMTSLPLYWPEGTGLADLASGRAVSPWQRSAIEQRYTLVPLDTLSPVAVPSDAAIADAPAVDPLADLARMAVIQPRGLSPADNVALDAWVRGGGRLLLVLDPALTGEYAAPLGDPRRPVDNALIPPVVARWGLAISFDEAQAPTVINVTLGEARLPLVWPGRIAITNRTAAQCGLLADNAVARCQVGKGQVTLIADAAVFEHPELAGEGGATLRAVLIASLR